MSNQVASEITKAPWLTHTIKSRECTSLTFSFFSELVTKSWFWFFPPTMQLSFGGIPVPSKPGTFLKKNFHGCIENLYYNGVNIIDLAKRRKHQIYTVVSPLSLLPGGLWNWVSLGLVLNPCASSHCVYLMCFSSAKSTYVVQLVEFLPSMYKTLCFIPTSTLKWVF